MTTSTQLKDKLGTAAVKHIGQLITQIWPAFEQQAFEQQCCTELETLALKQRVQHIINVLHDYLPEDFSEVSTILIAAGRQLLTQRQTSGWHDYAAWPLIDYVAEYGQHDVTTSLTVLEVLTPLFTAEFAIRPFVKNQFSQVQPFLTRWCQSDNEHLRRLASEAVRPRLPWGGHIDAFRADPSPILAIVSQLRHDKSRYVQKSVANNINDISKDQPDIALNLCREWQQQTSPECNWIIRHGLRSLVKQGHPEVFSLLGYTSEPKLNTASLQLDCTALKIGQRLRLKTAVRSAVPEPQRLVVDYRLYYQLANGRAGSKVFKWKNILLQPDETLILEKAHLFQQMSTRHYHSGKHTIELLVNGQSVDVASFMLIVD